jgi:hypothetical protein
MLSPRLPSQPLDADDGTLLFSLPKLCKLFIEQKRSVDLLVKLVTDLRDPKTGFCFLKRLDLLPPKKTKFVVSKKTLKRKEKPKT